MRALIHDYYYNIILLYLYHTDKRLGLWAARRAQVYRWDAPAGRGVSAVPGRRALFRCATSAIRGERRARRRRMGTAGSADGVEGGGVADGRPLIAHAVSAASPRPWPGRVVG